MDREDDKGVDRDRGAVDAGRRAPMMIVTIIIGMVLSIAAFRFGRQAEETRIQASFERAASERIVAVESRLLSTIGSLHSLASFFETDGEVSPEKFQHFVAPLIAAYAGVQAFEWAPMVSARDRTELESLRAQNMPGFRILERAPNGDLRAAGPREAYFPVFYAEPLRGNEKAIGYDLFSNPARRTAIEAAIRTHALQSTARITLVQEQGDQFGFLVFLPVYDRFDKFRGLVLGVFRVGDVVTRSGAYRLDDSDLTLTIRDLAADPREAQLFPSRIARPGRQAPSVTAARTLTVGGRPWKVEAQATQAFVARESGAAPWALLAACLFLTGNIAWLIDRRYAVEQEVVERTGEMRRARDEARAANCAKSDFLATMSHEIRTPLNGVIAMADHLLQRPLPVDQREPLEIIAKSSEHLLDVINDILDFSKLEARKLELENRPFNVESLVRHVVEIVAVQAEAKGLALEMNLAPDLPASLMGDSARLRQILLNLLSNAIKFTERGRVALDISSAERAHSSRIQMQFIVRDTGVGMSEATMSRLFTEFWQADNSISRRYGGTGLGLAISRRIAVQMGGDIKAASALGVGSAFTLALPMQWSAALPTPAPAPARPEAKQNFFGRRILLVEDNPTNRQIAKTILAGDGACIDEAHDGLEAVAAASTHRYDLILMDVHMPNMNGLDATRAIRALAAPWGQSPILGLSASAFEEDRQECAAAGMDDFLAKPYRAGPLRALVARVMQGAQAQPEPMPMPEPMPKSKPTSFAGATDADVNDEPAFVYENFAVLGSEIGEDDARQLLLEFMQDAQARLQTMGAHLEGENLRSLGEEAHALKSSAAMLGLARLAAVSRALEQAAARADLFQTQSLNHAAGVAFNDARPFVDEVLIAA